MGGLMILVSIGISVILWMDLLNPMSGRACADATGSG
jgi:hypothetical protein